LKELVSDGDWDEMVPLGFQQTEYDAVVSLLKYNTGPGPIIRVSGMDMIPVPDGDAQTLSVARRLRNVYVQIAYIYYQMIVEANQTISMQPSFY
jgi:hypothetical protein